MKVLVTGAAGFLGREVVRSAALAGHDVLALVRPTTDASAIDWPSDVEILHGDLRQVGDWAKHLGVVEAVVHLAAAPSGDLATQFAGTVVATENLLSHLPLQSLRRFVHVSSFSVYDYAAVGSGGAVTESTPIEPAPRTRDAYTMTKIAQERLVTETCAQAGVPLVVIRPGAIIGPGKSWGIGAVMKLGRFDLVYSPGARFPLTYVGNCAEAIARAIDAHVESGSVYNIVDDDLPSYGRYHRLGRRLGAAGRALYVPWFGVAFLGAAVSLVNRIGFKGRAKLPELLDRRRQQVRWQPMSYSNRAAKRDLGWCPAVPLETAVERIASASVHHADCAHEQPVPVAQRSAN